MLYEAIFLEKGEPKLPRSMIEEPSLAKYIDKFGLEKYDLCFVAVESGSLIGAAWGRLFSEKNKGYGFLDTATPELSIAMKEQFRNRGIGTRLIQSIVNEYQQMGLNTLSISVDKKNKAYELYKRLGFETILETDTSAVMRLLFA